MDNRMEPFCGYFIVILEDKFNNGTAVLKSYDLCDIIPTKLSVKSMRETVISIHARTKPPFTSSPY